MKPLNILPAKFIYLLAPVSFLLLASCGSYEYSGYETDGIYGDANRGYERQDQNVNQEDNKKDYYKSLFAEEAALYGDVLAEGAIFTDVDSYSSTGDFEAGDQVNVNYHGGNAPWGNDPDTYSINIINTGPYAFGMYPYWGGLYAYDPFFGPGYWGPGYYRPGFYHYGFAYHNPAFWPNPYGIGYGGWNYGYGFAVHPFIYGAGGWYNPYNFYRPRYFNDYNRNNIAYSAGRRNTTSSYGNSNATNLRNATNLNSRGRSSSYSRSIRNLRNSNDDYGITRRTVSREYNPARVNSNSPYRSSNSRSYERSTRSRGTYSQPTTTRRASSTVRSSTSTRSSGSTRSSSGGRSSSSGSNRGRGN